MRIRNPGRTTGIVGAGMAEFGGLINSRAAAELGDMATDLGISGKQLIGLERVFQGNQLGLVQQIYCQEPPHRFHKDNHL